MANRSKVILQENKNTHRSRIIKAFQSYEDIKDTSLKPDGVWGSTATINIKSEVSSAKYTDKIDITFKSDELDFEFEIPFDDNLEANEGEIVIYNLSDNTLAELSKIIKNRKKGSKKDTLTITAGYEGDTGVIFKGYMTKVFTRQENADRVTTIKIIDDIEVKETLERTESGDAQTILKTLVKELASKTNLSIGRMKFARNYTYNDSVSIDDTLESSIKKFSEVCGVSTFISKGVIYCCKLNEIDDTGIFKVTTGTGMIGSPQPFTEEVNAEDKTYTIEGFEIDMLLQHRMSTGAVIQLSSRDYKGTYYVKSGYHRFNESECVTHIQAIEVA